MKKTLLANGCSWTAGGGLDNIHNPYKLESILWPHQLSKLLNYDNCVNLSAGCGSNQRIVRTTFNWLTSQDSETLKNTIAVIQWTELSRYEYYHTTNDNQYEDIERNWAKVKTGVVISPADPLNYLDSTLERSQRRYELYTDVEGLYTHLTHLETLHSLFNHFGVKYYYWNFTMAYDLVNHPLSSFILSRYNWLEKYGRHTWDYQRISTEDPHPNEHGHYQIAKHIFDAMDSVDKVI